MVGLYKTEPIKPKRPWEGLDDLEIATPEWLDWFNRRRPYDYCDYLTLVKQSRLTTLTTRPRHRAESQISKSQDSPGRFTLRGPRGWLYVCGVNNILDSELRLFLPAPCPWLRGLSLSTTVQY